MSTSINIGIIGCGRAAELIYLPALKKFSEEKVTAVVDPFEERRKLISKEFGNCSQYNSIDENFFNQIDAGIICSPPNTHIDLASKLLKKNKHVLVEKPLALSMDGVEELSEIAALSKAFLMMGFNHRYWQPVAALKEGLTKSTKIKSAEISFSGNYSSWDPVSFTSDPLNDLGPHVFDLIRFIFNQEIISIRYNGTGRSSIKNNFEFNLKTSKGISINCEISHSNKTLKTIKVITDKNKFYLTNSSIRINSEPDNIRYFFDLKDKIKRKITGTTSPIKNAYEVQLKNFFNSIRVSKPTPPGIRDGIYGILALEAANASIKKNGKEIFLDEIE